MAEQQYNKLKVGIKFEPWVSVALDGMFESLTRAVENGMPSDTAEEVAREVAKLIYGRGMRVEVPRKFDPVVLSGYGGWMEQIEV